MKLKDLKAVLAAIEAAKGEDAEVVFTDYSQRSYPTLDWEGPEALAQFEVSRHTHESGPHEGAVALPLSRI